MPNFRTCDSHSGRCVKNNSHYFYTTVKRLFINQVMDIYKNIEIHKEFRVSNTAVGRWIEAAKKGKNNLQLKETKPGVFKILRNEHNRSELLRLKVEGEKNKNSMNLKVTEPHSAFYTTFDEHEITEIIRDLDKRREIEYKFTFKDGGAQMWDKFYNDAVEKGDYPTPKRTLNLLYRSIDLIAQHITKNAQINIIDIGCGNSHPLKGFIELLSKRFKINRYIAIDISQEILDFSKKNMENWFPNLPYFSHKMDIERFWLGDLIYEYKFASNLNQINLIFNIGSNIGNHFDRVRVLKNIQSGMLRSDLFIIGNTLHNNLIRSELSYKLVDSEKDKDAWIPKLIGIDVENPIMVTRFDEHAGCKISSLVLDKDYEILFKTKHFNRKLYFSKKEEIIVWRHYMTNMDEFYNELSSCGLRMIAMNTETDYSHVMAICQAV